MLSTFILDELDRVLRYPRLRQLHALADEEIESYVRSVASAALVVSLTGEDTPAVVADPDDHPVVETVLVGGAEVLCTLDRHLRTEAIFDFCTANGIRVLTDVELLAEFRSPSEGDQTASPSG